ncbi:hypothetical protein [Salirhabdus salicampi]|uniref:hypothetical protein n=1 Tax=Salirhabdus salicampi TaxID=476102 RepID=UPI0020C295AB|nr:hypothetical protein [Salirhabdus salicampi]MCP8616214.1 hypothetical protein [Salirhabdus salicampi]
MKRNKNERTKASLDGMKIYGTTGNVEVEGYQMSGDIENAGRLDKGYTNNQKETSAEASINKE